jgi:Uma2 family endonuclease
VDIEGFIPVVPDFVIELRSATDNLSTLQTKMSEYQRLGVKLGILINPQDTIVEIYRQDRDVEIVESPMSFTCNDVMPGFVMNLEEIW